MGNGVLLQGLLISVLFETQGEQTVLFAPITQVVDTHNLFFLKGRVRGKERRRRGEWRGEGEVNLVAKGSVDILQEVTENGGTQVT